MIKSLDFIGYENYCVDTEGNIYKKLKSGDLFKLKLYKNKLNGYLYKNLYHNSKSKTFRVHKLIALAFIPNTNPDYNQINHIDGDKTNNKVLNLEWCNLSENIKHAYKNGLWEPKIFQKHSKPVNVYTLQGELLYKHISTRDAARKIGCSVSSITRAWKYYEGIMQRIGYRIELCNDYPKDQP